MGANYISDENGEFEIAVRVKTFKPHEPVYIDRINTEELSLGTEIEIEIIKGRER